MLNDYREVGKTVELVTVPAAHAWAIDVQDESRGLRARLGAAELVVGTARGVDVLLRDDAVSGRHCSVCVLGGGVAIRDLGSRNGTYVGGARIKEAWGGAGTVVTIGRSTIVVSAVHETDEDDLLAPALPGLAGASAPMRRVAVQVRRLARHSAPVLIAGESGTGKELIARALHDEGPRRAGPFIALNVAALPRELVESELFGHERGAFTGAVARRDGAFRDAETGSLFLDEIGELPLEAQPKLLRALDGYEVRRVGGSGAGRPPDVRVIAATHVPLEARVTAGSFRGISFTGSRSSSWRSRRSATGRPTSPRSPVSCSPRWRPSSAADVSRPPPSRGSWFTTGPGTSASCGTSSTGRATSQ